MLKSLPAIILIAACVILSVNALKSISESYSVSSVYQLRKKQTEKQYLEVIKKKNELDYINSPFFVEKQLRESLNYYRKGEKLLVFTQPPAEVSTNKTAETTATPLQQWLDFFRDGIRNPL